MLKEDNGLNLVTLEDDNISGIILLISELFHIENENIKIEVDITLKTEGNESSDKYINSATSILSNSFSNDIPLTPVNILSEGDLNNTKEIDIPLIDEETAEIETTPNATAEVIKRKLSGKIWIDRNRDGLIDENEKGLSGIEVELLNSDNTSAIDIYGNVITSVTSGEDGSYSFENMTNGKYIVKLKNINSAYQITKKEVGNNKEINNKFNQDFTSDEIQDLNSIDTGVSTVNNINAGFILKDSKVIVHYYEEGTTNKVSEDVILDGQVFDEYATTPAIDVAEKYELVEMPENKSGTMAEETIEVIYYYKVKDSQVIVKYLEKGTNAELSEEKILNGKVDEEYQTTARTIENYALVEDTKNTEGKYTLEPITVIYYYLQKAKVQVNHINQVTGEILDTVEQEGLEGNECTSISKNFENYILVEKPEKETVIMTKEEIVLNYYYMQVSVGVIEKHINLNTKEILYNELHEKNDSYKVEKKKFENYRMATNKEVYENKVAENPEILQENAVNTLEELLTKLGLNAEEEYIPVNKEGVMPVNAIEVIYYYNRYVTKVKVEYIDKTTGENIIEKSDKDEDGDGELDIKNSTVEIPGCEGDSYKTEAKEFEDYLLIEEPTNKEGIMTKDPIEVKYYYAYKAKVIEKHIDIMSDKVLQEQQYEGKEDDSYSTTSKDFENYDLTTLKKYYEKYPEEQKIELTNESKDKIYLPENKEGKMVVQRDETGMVISNVIYVNYYYNCKSNVIVEYLDEITGEKLTEKEKDPFTGKEIEKDSTEEIKGHEGDVYKAEAKTFENYELVKEKYPSNLEGKMLVKRDENGNIIDNTVKVQYYYVHNSAGVIERHIDINTDKLLEEETVHTGHEGDLYKIDSKKFEGYDVVESMIPANKEGKMTIEPIKVEYYYVRKTYVQVEYIEKGTNKKLAEDAIINGHEGDKYKTQAKDIEGYKNIDSTSNIKGEMAIEPIEVIYYYEKQTEEAPVAPTQQQPQNLVNNNINVLNNGGNLTPNVSSQAVDKGLITPGTGDVLPLIAISVISLVILANIVQMIIYKNNKKTNL